MSFKRITGILLITLGVLLGLFQTLLVGIAALKGYWLIHEWLFYFINYLIIFFLFVVGALVFAEGNKKWALLLYAFAFTIANSTFFYYMGNVNLLVVESEDGQHEVIIKEYKKMKKETVRLVRRGAVFSKEVAVFKGSSDFKAFEEGRYKIGWTSGDIAAVTYQTDRNGVLDQQIFNFRSSDYVRYQNVAVSLTGKWIEQSNPENYFMSDNNEMVYVKDGQLYYYNIRNTEQFGIYSVLVKGAGTAPTLSIVLNAGTEFDDSSIADGGTITITPLSLGKTEGGVYKKEE